MKRLLCAITLTGSMLLTGCNLSENSEDDTEQSVNLMNVETLNDEGWINFDGEISSSANEMVHTESISYIPNNEYLLNDSAYVSYFNNDDFIKTVLHDGENPIKISNVEEANNIKLSFSNKKAERIVLSEK